MAESWSGPVLVLPHQLHASSLLHVHSLPSSACALPALAIAPGPTATLCGAPRRLLVTSEDYTIRFYGKPDGGEASLEREIPHDNNKGCFHMPFRAVWTADGQSALCGSRSRGIDVIRASDGALSRLESPIQKTNCHRICCHPDRNVPVIAAAGSGGGMHLYCPL